MRNTPVLPDDYLKSKALQAELTAEQTAVFLLKFGAQKTNADTAKQLGISVNACVQCLGEIYKKFGIAGRGRGKEKRLRSELVQDFEANLVPGGSIVPNGLATQGLSAIDTQPLAALRPLASIAAKAPLTQFAQQPTSADSRFLQEWLIAIRESIDKLRTDEGRELAEPTLTGLLKTLPIAITALAADTQHTKAQVLEKILESVDRLVVDLQPRVEKNQIYGLRFLQEDSNPLARSTFAFIYRLRDQLGFDPQAFHTWQIIDQAIEAANRRYQAERAEESKQPHGIKTYSRRIRRLCFQIVRQQAAGIERPIQARPVKVTARQLRRNLQAVDSAILDLYLASKSRDQASFNFFDIIRMRWLMDIPWGTFSKLPDDDRHYLGVTAADQWNYEHKALAALRKAYHYYDRYDANQLEDMQQQFAQRIKLRQKTYCEKLFFEYRPDITDFYKIVAVPQVTGRANYDFEISKAVWTYCQLCIKPSLTSADLDVLEQLLEQARKLDGLDFWMREVDHFMAHKRENTTDSFIQIEAYQKAQLKKHAVR
ncbi:MAG: hypothetical protein F6J97_08970 [Leptolyngbya sp. SIO4C1]|nr:hypothetical protein [Leptolyngbya sp. SIO4C1]